MQLSDPKRTNLPPNDILGALNAYLNEYLYLNATPFSCYTHDINFGTWVIWQVQSIMPNFNSSRVTQLQGGSEDHYSTLT